MTISPFDAMQSAVDIVLTSPHETNKIAAALFGTGPKGADFCVRAINHWPDIISAKIGRGTRIGNSSGTVHAEVSCILQAPLTEGASICITDPFCPNCAKNIAEAGIKTIYIDHKGFDKEFAQRRADDLLDLSMRIVERAGIRVVEINRKAETLTPLITPSVAYRPQDENPVHLVPLAPDSVVASTHEIRDLILAHLPPMGRAPFAAGMIRGPHHPCAVLIAPQHASMGYNHHDLTGPHEIQGHSAGKYTGVMEPVNRLMMRAARLGTRLDPRVVVCSRLPTARESVNMVAAGLMHLHLIHPDQARDDDARMALRQLDSAGILHVSGV